jgi:hypothetical protein
MTMRIDVLGFEYDDVEPAFIQRDGYYLHLKTHRIYGKPSFVKWLAAEGLSFGAKELGTLSSAYQSTHLWGGLFVGKTTAATTLAPITASVTKAPIVKANDTGEITVAGGPADKTYTATVTIRDAASGGDDVQNVGIAKGDTSGTVAAKIAAAVSDPNVKASATGSVVEVKPKAGSHFTKLTVSIA